MSQTTNFHPEIAALCAAIDAGHDAALVDLADAMEEAGDVRAAGVRSAGPASPSSEPGGWIWKRSLSCVGGMPTVQSEVLSQAIYDALTGGRVHRKGGRGRLPSRIYPSRSAAFVALAEALAAK